jgi:hypothetical protein
MTGKFCVDCYHYSGDGNNKQTSKKMYFVRPPTCVHPEALSEPDPVTGDIRACEVRMFRTHRCEGKLWEEKAPSPSTWFQTLLRKIL